MMRMIYNQRGCWGLLYLLTFSVFVLSTDIGWSGDCQKVTISEANRSRVVNSCGIQLFTPSIYEVQWDRQDRGEAENGGIIFGICVCRVGERKLDTPQRFASSDIFSIDTLNIDKHEVSSRVWAHETGGLEIDSQYRAPPDTDEDGKSSRLQLSWRQKLRIIYRARPDDKSQLAELATNEKRLSTDGLQDQVVGLLGYPLGTPVTVRGQWKALGLDGRGLSVTEVNGKRLAVPVVWPNRMIRWHDFLHGSPGEVVQVRLQDVGTMCDLCGCEVIEYQGVPDGYASYDRAQQTAAGLQSGFRLWKRVDSMDAKE